MASTTTRNNGQTTREKLLKEAAKAFAEDGYAGASLRKIQVAAGVNSATNHYHYGSKAALYQGVVRASLEPIVEERIRLIEAVDPKLPPAEKLQALIGAYMRPHLERVTLPEGLHYGRILARLLVERRTPEVNAVFAELVTPTRTEFIWRLGRLFPEAGPDKLARAVGLVVSVMALAPFDSIYSQVTEKPPAADRATVLAAAPRFAAAGVLALCGPLVSVS